MESDTEEVNKMAKTQKKGTFLSAAKAVLSEAGKAMSYTDITKAALAKKLIETKGKTPEATMSSTLSVAVRNNDGIIKTEPNMYALEALKSKSQERQLKSQPSANGGRDA